MLPTEPLGPNKKEEIVEEVFNKGKVVKREKIVENKFVEKGKLVEPEMINSQRWRMTLRCRSLPWKPRLMKSL